MYTFFFFAGGGAPDEEVDSGMAIELGLKPSMSPRAASFRSIAAFFLAVFSDVLRCRFWNSTRQHGGTAQDSDSQLTGQESVPALVSQLRVFRQFAPDHELLDSVDGVNIVHAVDNDPSDFFQTLVSPHRSDRVSLYQDITLRQELNSLRVSLVFSGNMLAHFQRGPARTNNPLSPLDETLLVPHESSDFDHVACDVVLEHFQRLIVSLTRACRMLTHLRRRHTPRKELQQVPTLENDIRIPGLSRCLDGHLTLDQVELTR